jgi:DNA-binding response OmpR family regulator
MVDKIRSIGSTSASNDPGQTPLILLADDHEDSLLLMSYAIESLGINFVAARTGREVMALAYQHPFSLVLLDIVLPDINGIRLCRWLRQNQHTQNSPIIAVTALAQLRDRQTVMEAGFSDYLVKPYMLDELDALIKKYLPCNISAS